MNPIIEKIKKLLRMKRGGTPAEIATALKLAQELAAKHNIDLAAINPDDEGEGKIAHEDVILGSRVPWECKYSALVCLNFFHVNCLFHQLRFEKRLAFIGTQRDIEISRYVYTFIVRSMRDLWKNKRGRSKDRRSFLYGIFLAICSTLREQQAQQETREGLLVINRGLALRSNYMTKHFGATKESDARPDNNADCSIQNGYYAGKSIEINKGLNSPGHTARQIAAKI